MVLKLEEKEKMVIKNRNSTIKSKLVSEIAFLLALTSVQICETVECNTEQLNTYQKVSTKDGESGTSGCGSEDGQKGQDGAKGILGLDGGHGGNGGNSESGKGGDGGNGGDAD